MTEMDIRRQMVRQQAAVSLFGLEATLASMRQGGIIGSMTGTEKSVDADVTKVGPHGYIHGWIKVGDPKKTGKIRDNGDGSFSVRPAGGYAEHTVKESDAETYIGGARAKAAQEAWKPRKGDTMVDTRSGKVGFHNGVIGPDRVGMMDAKGNQWSASKSSVRRATSSEMQMLGSFST
jgi:hypothetical protein